MSTFKIILISVFGLFIILAIAVFALSKSDSPVGAANLVAWGTLPEDTFDAAYKASSLANNKLVQVKYVKKDVATFDNEFVNALADGNGPDIVISRDDSIYKNRNRFFIIPYKSFTERDFKDKFIEEGELFLTPDGIIAVPFIVDPMVMYWNRDMFSNNLIAQPPKYWEDIPSLVDKMTKRDSSGYIPQSAIALGEWRNITNAKEIVAMLLLQAGTPITSRNKDAITSVLNSQFNHPVVPSDSAITFYTKFSNPTLSTYTWNRSLQSSLNYFLSGNLAMYLGFASEIYSIQQKNSNLNFDVTYVPQIKLDTAKKTVFSHMYALSIVKQSKQPGVAFSAINALTEPAALKALEVVTDLPPVRRDLLSDKPTDAFRIVFYNSALLSRSWIDPDPSASSNTFRDMIESITSGRKRQGQALDQANEELNQELK